VRHECEGEVLFPSFNFQFLSGFQVSASKDRRTAIKVYFQFLSGFQSIVLDIYCSIDTTFNSFPDSRAGGLVFCWVCVAYAFNSFPDSRARYADAAPASYPWLSIPFRIPVEPEHQRHEPRPRLSIPFRIPDYVDSGCFGCS